MNEALPNASAYAGYTLALLMIVYILNFLDRTIIYILFLLTSAAG